MRSSSQPSRGTPTRSICPIAELPNNGPALTTSWTRGMPSKTRPIGTGKLKASTFLPRAGPSTDPSRFNSQPPRKTSATRLEKESGHTQEQDRATAMPNTGRFNLHNHPHALPDRARGEIPSEWILHPQCLTRTPSATAVGRSPCRWTPIWTRTCPNKVFAPAAPHLGRVLAPRPKSSGHNSTPIT
jgi:hypothetical protein